MNNYIYKKERLKMTSLAIVYDAGSELETDGHYGTMHLMEHLICKTFKDLYPMFSANGIDWNAHTSESKIVVWLEGLSSRFTSEIKIDILKRLCGGIECVNENEFDTEKTVVIQEYFDSIVDDMQTNYLNMMRRYWNDYCPIGKFEDIKSFDYQNMLDAYSQYFKYPTRIIEIGPEKTEQLAEFCDPSNVKKFKHKKPLFGKYENELINENSHLKIPVYMLFPKTVTKKDYPLLRVGLSMLVDGIESPYYDEIRVKNGLSYYVIGNIEKNIEGGKMIICACTDVVNADNLLNKMSDLSMKTYDYLTDDRFDIVMNGMKVNREKENMLKYAYTNKYANLSKLKMPSDLDKIELADVRYIMSRYFADVKVIKGTF